MTVRANKFTPEVLLSAPRRGPAIPNKDGSLILYTESAYSFKTRSRSSAILVYNDTNKHTTVITDNVKASDPAWLGDGNKILWLQAKDTGETALVVGDVDSGPHGSQTLYDCSGPVSNLKVTPLASDTFAIAVSGRVGPDGRLYNPHRAAKPHSTARVYESLFVRHWDSYLTSNRNTIWYASLKRSSDTTAPYQMCSFGLMNALAHSPLESPVPPFGGTDHFDISSTGIVFVAKDPKLNPATHTKSDPYFVPLSSFQELTAPKPRRIHTPNPFQGATSSPVFSPDGRSVALLRMKNIAYESDRNHILVIRDVADREARANEILAGVGTAMCWGYSPSSVVWKRDGTALYLTAECLGQSQLFVKPYGNEAAHIPPKLIATESSISDVRPIHGDSVILSSSSLVDSSAYTLLSTSQRFPPRTLSSASNHGRLFGLSSDQISEIWFDDAKRKRRLHAWVVRPSSFDESKTYPLAYLIHGGPQGAWLNSWSTRWNPAVFAEQGYVVVCPNPTGSTGYGQPFTDAIQGQWGGLPYQDLVSGFNFLRDSIPYIDTSRAVALGASYGGYMMNWIQGHPLGREFKALVTHDGVFSTLNQYSSEELYFPQHDFEGTLWENRRGYEEWDPARFISQWSTPHLIIHNELDYRLPISEGLAAFNALQVRGVRSRFLSFPDENHWVLKPENSLVWHRVVLDWINEFVGLRENERDEWIRVAAGLVETQDDDDEDIFKKALMDA